MERPFNMNKYQSEVSTQVQNNYLNYSIDPIFSGINRLSVLSFQDILYYVYFRKNYNLLQWT